MSYKWREERNPCYKRIGGGWEANNELGKRKKRDEGSMPGTVECAPVFPMEEFSQTLCFKTKRPVL